MAKKISVAADGSPPVKSPKSPALSRTPQRASSLLDTRVIYCGDNLEQLAKLPDACVDLIYIDPPAWPKPLRRGEGPPFNSNRNYDGGQSGSDFWGETKEKRACNSALRTPPSAFALTGSFYYHCDWHASHYVKVKAEVVALN
jgi:hypothetical protein